MNQEKPLEPEVSNALAGIFMVDSLSTGQKIQVAQNIISMFLQSVGTLPEVAPLAAPPAAPLAAPPAAPLAAPPAAPLAAPPAAPLAELPAASTPASPAAEPAADADDAAPVEPLATAPSEIQDAAPSETTDAAPDEIEDEGNVTVSQPKWTEVATSAPNKIETEISKIMPGIKCRTSSADVPPECHSPYGKHTFFVVPTKNTVMLLVGCFANNSESDDVGMLKFKVVESKFSKAVGMTFYTPFESFNSQFEKGHVRFAAMCVRDILISMTRTEDVRKRNSLRPVDTCKWGCRCNSYKANGDAIFCFGRNEKGNYFRLIKKTRNGYFLGPMIMDDKKFVCCAKYHEGEVLHEYLSYFRQSMFNENFEEFLLTDQSSSPLIRLIAGAIRTEFQKSKEFTGNHARDEELLLRWVSTEMLLNVDDE